LAELQRLKTIWDRVVPYVDEGRLVDATRALIAVDTITGNENRLVGELSGRLEALRMPSRVVEFQPGRSNVYGWQHGRGDGPTILLIGHVDTVEVANWAAVWGDDERADPRAGVLREGCLWGLGAADEKGGIAAVLSALGALDAAGLEPAGDIVVAFVGDEESGQPGTGRSAGTKALAAELSESRLPFPDFAVYTEPTNLDLYVSQPGFLIATIEIQGHASYFAYPWLGRSAIRDAEKLLAALDRYEAELWARDPHPTVGHPLLVVTGIHGGESVAVPERCSVELIRTVLPNETMDRARRELEDLLRRLAIEHGVQATLGFPASRDDPIGGTPMETNVTDHRADLLARCLRIATSGAKIAGAPYWSELPILRAAGIPGVYFGPGDIALCHTPQERVPVEHLTKVACTLALFLAAGGAT
jgi:acetylornithine deacetylase